MTFHHLVNVAALTFAPLFVYFHATPMGEVVSYKDCAKASVVYLITSLLKLVCLATFLGSSESTAFSPLQEFIKAVVSLLDVAGLYVAFTQISFGISAAEKFQTIGLGWAFADTAVRRLAPMAMGALQPDFTYAYLRGAGEANVQLLSSLAGAAVAMLLWNRKSKPAWIGPYLYAALGLHAMLPVIAGAITQAFVLGAVQQLGLNGGLAALLAIVAWRLHAACAVPAK